MQTVAQKDSPKVRKAMLIAALVFDGAATTTLVWRLRTPVSPEP